MNQTVTKYSTSFTDGSLLLDETTRVLSFLLNDEIEERYKKAKAYVDKLTQSILAKAFRGELVPQDPNDEPAEKLLERIKDEKKKMEMTKKRKVGRESEI